MTALLQRALVSGGWSASLNNPLDWLQAIAASRRALWATVLAAACLMFLSARLPLADVPQHAAQVALWRDLLLGTSPWSDLVRINLLTPYLAGYGAALPFSFFMSAGQAITLVTVASYVAFVATSIGFRKEAGADARLDWLFVACFYGFAWRFGFISFLVASPVVMIFARLALRHARAPSVRSGLVIVGLGVTLLWMHALAFVFACAVGGAMALAWSPSVRAFAWSVVPYVFLGSALVATMAASQGFGSGSGPSEFIYGSNVALRVALVVAFNHGFGGDLFILSAILLLAPARMGLRPEWRAAAPFATVLAVMALVPHEAMKTSYLFERYSMFVMPFFVAMFVRSVEVAPSQFRIAKLATAGLVVSCWAAIGIMGVRLVQFGQESADFEVVLASAEPGKRALAIMTERDSKAMRMPETYAHHALWYQADKGGFVDFNFASFHPQVVRFKPEHIPAADLAFERAPQTVDWRRHNARIYDYFFVRHGTLPLPPQLVENGECRLETVASAGAWTLLKRGACKN